MHHERYSYWNTKHPSIYGELECLTFYGGYSNLNYPIYLRRAKEYVIRRKDNLEWVLKYDLSGRIQLNPTWVTDYNIGTAISNYMERLFGFNTCVYYRYGHDRLYIWREPLKSLPYQRRGYAIYWHPDVKKYTIPDNSTDPIILSIRGELLSGANLWETGLGGGYTTKW